MDWRRIRRIRDKEAAMTRHIKSKSIKIGSGAKAPKLQPIKVDDTLTPRFRQLALELERATLNASSPNTITGCPAFRRIVGLGDAAIPLVLARMLENHGEWCLVLRQLAGANPVPQRDRGNVPKMVKAWTAWGKANGHIA